MQARRTLKWIAKALVEGEFELHYQPIHDLKSNALRVRSTRAGTIRSVEQCRQRTSFPQPRRRFHRASGRVGGSEACAEARWPAHSKIR
jgi:hypothetical protein